MTIPYYADMHSETMNFIKSYQVNPAKWLDTGCGTGNLVVKARDVFQRTDFYICDPSVEMLSIAMQKLGHSIVNLGCRKTSEIGKDFAGRFDVVTAIQCFHYMNEEERRVELRACYSLLKEDGVFITFENTRPIEKESERAFFDYWINFQIDKGKKREDAERHIRRYDREYFPITLLEHLRLLKDIGFRRVDLLWYAYMQSGYVCIK
jgi:tRNA (cmo5U34)-methyltransferase